MKALVVLDSPTFVDDYPSPLCTPGCALVAPIYSGICRTDLEIVRGGYAGFQGVLGHEFVGRVVHAASLGSAEWMGQRVVGEINWPCGECAWCRRGGAGNHCPQRRALGIRNWNGAFAELLEMPLANLHLVPESVSDRQAVFCEPLAAAYSLLASLRLRGGESILGIGDGRLGLLVAQVLHHQEGHLYWAGRHESKLELLRQWGIPAGQADRLRPESELWDIVVDTSGTPEGLQLALRMVRPGGTVAVKTTTHLDRALDLNDLVVRELTLVGSRCGPFKPALEALRAGQIQVEPLISAVFPLGQGVQALERAAQPGTLKVLLQH